MTCNVAVALCLMTPIVVATSPYFISGLPVYWVPGSSTLLKVSTNEDSAKPIENVTWVFEEPHVKILGAANQDEVLTELASDYDGPVGVWKWACAKVQTSDGVIIVNATAEIRAKESTSFATLPAEIETSTPDAFVEPLHLRNDTAYPSNGTVCHAWGAWSVLPELVTDESMVREDLFLNVEKQSTAVVLRFSIPDILACSYTVVPQANCVSLISYPTCQWYIGPAGPNAAVLDFWNSFAKQATSLQGFQGEHGTEYLKISSQGNDPLVFVNDLATRSLPPERSIVPRSVISPQRLTAKKSLRRRLDLNPASPSISKV